MGLLALHRVGNIEQPIGQSLKKVPLSKTKLFKKTSIPNPSVFIHYSPHAKRAVIRTITSSPVSDLYRGTRTRHYGYRARTRAEDSPRSRTPRCIFSTVLSTFPDGFTGSTKAVGEGTSWSHECTFKLQVVWLKSSLLLSIFTAAAGVAASCCC